uniref:uncharacterized protein LOC101309181 n=1 Tax=Fragaria vesca subsp. vesca TaxID=101020 RepID=UPI0005C8CD33|nr:PREDICTED: uncharacterized protein LOC101309181 [Fragaria vesca subsp. vesca]
MKQWLITFLMVVGICRSCYRYSIKKLLSRLLEYQFLSLTNVMSAYGAPQPMADSPSSRHLGFNIKIWKNISKVTLLTSDNETADHLFGHCDFTTEVFRLVGISAPMDWHKGYLKVLREMFINQPYDKFLFAKVLIIYWQIWKARNDTIFRDVITTATNVVATAAFHFNETALYKAVVGGGRSAVGGFVFRNSDGNVILAAAKGLGSTTIPTAEATALRDNLVKARDRGYMNVQVEGDSKLVIDAINGKLSPPWRLQKIVQDIRTIATSFSSVCFNHVYREANFVADAFANEGHQLPNGREWQDGYSAAVAKALGNVFSSYQKKNPKQLGSHQSRSREISI